MPATDTAFPFTAPRSDMFVTSKDGQRRATFPNTDANFREAFIGRFAWSNRSDGKVYEVLTEEQGLAWLKAERETYRRQCAEFERERTERLFPVVASNKQVAA